MLCFPKMKKGKRVWEAKFYFTEVEHLFDKLVKLALADGINDGSWDDVVKRISDVKALIANQITPALTRGEAGLRVVRGGGV